MSHSSYTASERRGILAVALIALLILIGGSVLSLCGRQTSIESGQVIELPELVDSINMQSKQNKSEKSKKTKSDSSKKKNNQKKTYRRRSPLDEPV